MIICRQRNRTPDDSTERRLGGWSNAKFEDDVIASRDTADCIRLGNHIGGNIIPSVKVTHFEAKVVRASTYLECLG